MLRAVACTWSSFASRYRTSVAYSTTSRFATRNQAPSENPTVSTCVPLSPGVSDTDARFEPAGDEPTTGAPVAGVPPANRGTLPAGAVPPEVMVAYPSEVGTRIGGDANIGKGIYTHFLDDEGMVRADLTVIRMADRCRIVDGADAGPRDFH